MAAFAIPVLVAVIIGCIVRIRNMRMIIFVFFLKVIFLFEGKLHHLNSFINDVKTGGINRNSVLGNWMNRRQGFERLEQCSDGENEPLESNIPDDSNHNSGDESFTITTKQQGNGFNNKSTTGIYKMGEDL